MISYVECKLGDTRSGVIPPSHDFSIEEACLPLSKEYGKCNLTILFTPHAQLSASLRTKAVRFKMIIVTSYSQQFDSWFQIEIDLTNAHRHIIVNLSPAVQDQAFWLDYQKCSNILRTTNLTLKLRYPVCFNFYANMKQKQCVS